MSKQTVFILGAGASKEVELPLGNELTHQIAQLLDFDDLNDSFAKEKKILLNALNRQTSARDENSVVTRDWKYACERIRRAMKYSTSIDSFIKNNHGNKGIELCSKLAIISLILRAERKSTHFRVREHSDSEVTADRIQSTWLAPFAKLLLDSQKEELPERLRKVTLIIFNYDRCVEHFLLHAIRAYHGVKAAEAAELLENLKIYHPYGTVGRLPWAGGENSVDFGKEIPALHLLDVANEIRTFSEGIDPESSEITEIRRTMIFANTLIFLGFAYHDINMDLLTHPAPRPKPAHSICYMGTAHGFSEDDMNHITDDLRKLVVNYQGDSVVRNDLSCRGFFEKYPRRLQNFFA